MPALRAHTVLLDGSATAAPAAAEAVPEQNLSRKERKQLEARNKLDKKLAAITQLGEENKATVAADGSRPRTSLTGFWRKRKEKSKACVFVGNLPLDITDKAVKAFFREDGPIESLRWLPSTSTGCMVYCQFKDIEAATRAVERDDTFYDTYKLRVNFANDKKERKAAIARRNGEDITADEVQEMPMDLPVQPTLSEAKRRRLEELPPAPRDKVIIID
eukprot:TRINITY_DN17108_c0_g2_i1.p1 TRINITY_DN17108_c0_g2~~TRINITY_DN17108_c0_g2_i1.p1  ORF type:complete len:248 (+),score=83.10 TRINITY_DN17108_c0_g2_i1:92-745(+)